MKQVNLKSAIYDILVECGLIEPHFIPTEYAKPSALDVPEVPKSV